jgi:hypothetical protein
LARNLILYLIVFSFFAFSACKKESSEHIFDYQTLGTSGNDLLSSSHYSSLQIEIQYMHGYAPDPAALNNLTVFLKGLLNKPNGIKIIQKEIPASTLFSLPLNYIVNNERRTRVYFTGNGVITVYVLITNGYYSDNNILATSYWNTSFCIFGKALNDNSGQIGQVSNSILMTTIMEHEFGHLMGLVDQGSPMQVNHKDATNGAHCSNPNCLMYYNVEAGFTNEISAVPSLDANCLADLKVNGSK